MPTRPGYVPLAGSERAPLPAALPTAQEGEAVAANEQIAVTVRLRARPGGALPSAQPLGARPLRQRRHLSRDAYAAAHGADPDDLARVEAFARREGLSVVETSAARRSVRLTGPAERVAAAFDTALTLYQHAGQTYRVRRGPLGIPADLAGIIEGVFGLDNRPQAQPHFRRRDQAAVAVSYTPPQVAQLYDFPTNLTGQGECIALIELGGGFVPADLTTYFGALGLTPPAVVAVSVDGGQNAPGDPQGADGEVMLDIEVAGAVAPGARVAVYFAPNTDQGFLDAVTTAVHDTTNQPSVVSISWGSAEANWTQQALTAMDQAFQAAAAVGVTICVASGDNGASDGATGLNVDFPASSPHALGCGGTTLEGSGGTITSEVVWNELPDHGATGGGVSAVFSLPEWQAQANVPAPPSGSGGRGVPDVAGDADPETGYRVRVDGQDAVIGGTSAVAPLWAGLIALINQAVGQPAGYLNPLLYSLPAGSAAFHDITSGNNDGYTAGPGWDACTGLGSPDGAQLLAALTSTSG